MAHSGSLARRGEPDHSAQTAFLHGRLSCHPRDYGRRARPLDCISQDQAVGGIDDRVVSRCHDQT